MTEDEIRANRRKLAELVAAVIQQTAEVIKDDRREVNERFPRMAYQPEPVLPDPDEIRDFTQSREYQEAVADYIAGRLEVNFLVRVLELLRRVAPREFVGSS